MLPKAPQALLAAAAHKQQPTDLKGQYGQHAGHDIEQKPGQHAKQQGLAQTGNFQTGVQIARREAQVKAVGRRQGGLRRCEDVAGGQTDSRAGSRGTDSARRYCRTVLLRRLFTCGLGRRLRAYPPPLTGPGLRLQWGRVRRQSALQGFVHGLTLTRRA